MLFLSRCKRFDISFVIARLASFVTRWCEWARKEIRHILGFDAHTAAWSLDHEKCGRRLGRAEAQHFLRCVVRHEMFRKTQSQADGVEKQPLLDRVGKSSAGPESESIECGRAAKATLRVKGALDACRSSQFLVMVTWTTMRSAWQ